MHKTSTRMAFLFIATLLVAPLAAAAAPTSQPHAAPCYAVTAFGARPDGTTRNTQAIQAAIDAASAAGGGTVFFPAGKYLTGTIILKNNITLSLDNGAVLVGSTEAADFRAIRPGFQGLNSRHAAAALIYAENVENVAIIGRGTIDGQGGHPAFAHTPANQPRVRPYILRFVTCRNVLIEDVTLINSPTWVQHYLACDNLTIRGITVSSNVNRYNDMLDIDCCKNVHVSGCTGDSGDDAIVLKSTGDRICENVTISDCVVSSHSNAFKLGTETTGGFRNITITNCAVRPSAHKEMINGRPKGYSGIALEIMDGGILERVTVSNMVIEGTMAPIFIRLGNRARKHIPEAPTPGVGKLRNVVISNIVATGASPTGCAIAGIPGHPIENVTLRDIKITFDGGGTLADAQREIPEAEADYPEARMFGTLPAYGFYCRHVKGLTLDNVHLGFDEPDRRPAIVCDDVQDLQITGFRGAATRDGAEVVRLLNVAGAMIRGCVAPATDAAFMSLMGEHTRDIVVIGNDLSRAGRGLQLGTEVKPASVFEAANRMPK